MLDKERLKEMVRDENVLIIHHWDTDGIASACILMRELEKMGCGEIDNCIPPLGEYEMRDEWIRVTGIDPPDLVITADLCIPRDNLLKIRDGIDREIVMFDHHARSPVAEDDIHFVNYASLRNEEWVSNTLVLNKFFGRDEDVLSALGVVGDKGRKAEGYRDVWPPFERDLRSAGSDLKTLLRATELLDSCYKSGRRKAAVRRPWLLKNKRRGGIVDAILGDEELRTFDEEIRQIIETLSGEEPERRGAVLFKRIDSGFQIISALTRKLSDLYPDDEVVVNGGVFEDKSQLYLRSKRRDVRPVIELVKEMGQSAGGKTDVVGAVVRDEMLNDVLDHIGERIPSLKRRV